MRHPVLYKYPYYLKEEDFSRERQRQPENVATIDRALEGFQVIGQGETELGRLFQTREFLGTRS